MERKIEINGFLGSETKGKKQGEEIANLDYAKGKIENYGLSLFCTAYPHHPNLCEYPPGL